MTEHGLKEGLKLGLVGPLPPPNGGMAMQTLQLAAILREKQVEVELVQSNAPYRPAFVERIRGLRALFRLLPYLFRVWRLAGRNDVIHLMANSGWSWQLFAAPVIWAGWLRGTPVVVNYRGGEAREYLAQSVARVRPTLKRASRLVVPSAFLQSVFRDFGFQAEVVPNIVDLDLFSASDSVARSENTFTLVVTRNLEAIYGLDTALRALALVADEVSGVELKIAGSGPQLEELRELAQQLGIEHQVSFLGRLDRNGIVALYAEADAMLNPTRVDNMPNSVLEALACGLPVISTNVGGVPYIVEDRRTALLVPRDDPRAMAQAMIELKSDVELRATLRREGLAEVARYGRDKVEPLWFDLYRELEAAS